MTTTVTVVMNPAGVRAALTDPGVAADLDRRGHASADTAGPGHMVDSQIGNQRARTSVRTDTYEARRAEARDKALTRSLDAARQ